MDQSTVDPLRQQQPDAINEKPQALDGDYKRRDHRIVEAALRAKSKVTRQPQNIKQNGTIKSDTMVGNVSQTETGYGDGPGITSAGDEIEVMCGPLLNYKRMSFQGSGVSIWHGSVLIVTKSGNHQPELELKCMGPLGRQAREVGGSQLADGNTTQVIPTPQRPHGSQIPGLKLYADPAKAFWRFSLALPLQHYEARWEYSIANIRFLSGVSARTSLSRTFVVPAISESMRIMFHSCNGFSVGTDEDAWSGPALWADVNRVHGQKPLHVMVGGGDQIYNDGVRVNGPLKVWTDIGNPKKRRDYPFNEKLRAECDVYYFNNYVRWYSTEPFATANSQIPQINIWDDHDIIDGFGSYTEHFMKCAVFRGIGGIAHKYYLLFQHHIPPPKSTFTTSAPQTTRSQGIQGAGADPVQLADTFILKEEEDSSFIRGNRPGPYVEECSHSLYARLGARIALLGIDARTERTRHQVNYPDTYDLLFQRVRSELSAPSTPNGKITHLILLLGIPIAYPRLAWLENIFTSPIIGPIRLLNKRFGIAGSLFNKFDGQVDLLDDLDDHYTARQHKKERKELLLRLQALSKDYNIRVTILGGDVHLAALGRFYSNPKLNIPVDRDHRYMPNIISSAITNHPPPKAVANFLAHRNRIHHLDPDTDETLMKIFDKDPGSTNKTAISNQCTMPSRNYAIITETPPSSSTLIPTTTNGSAHDPATVAKLEGAAKCKDGHSPLGPGEEGAGTKHVAASGVHRGALAGGLDVALRAEIDQHDREGRTEGYGFSIPPLGKGQ